MRRAAGPASRAVRLLVWAALLALAAAALPAGAPAAGHLREPRPLRVLLVTAHPDDETMACMGRFRERGWRVSIALVTNGESGQVVQGIDAERLSSTGDVLLERPPGPGTWVVRPPAGPRLRRIATPAALAAERRREFLRSQAVNGVTRVYFLSGLRSFEFEDSWDDGVTRWDVGSLGELLRDVGAQVRPEVVVTLNPDETWAHPQHQGLGRIVRSLHAAGAFDAAGGARPPLYGIREVGWYAESLAPQTGDVSFDRTARSPVLGTTYARCWRTATSSYVSQSSHPVWFAARVRAGILPGYGAADVIRRLDAGDTPGLGTLFARFPPDRAAMRLLPARPAVVWLSADPGG